MAKTHEGLKPKIPVFHFKPEGYFSPGDKEFRDQFFAMLANQGLDPANLVTAALTA